jgi:1-acyl-sn-glycerol-3-phosphate acyltransferase
VVALGVSNPTLGTESLVIVAETRARDPGERDRLVAAVTERVAAAVEVPPDVVALVDPGAVPKTSSGKIRRAATRELYLAGELGRPARTPLSTRARLLAVALLAGLRPWLGRAARGLYLAWVAVALPLTILPLWLLVACLPGRRLAFALGRFTVRVCLRLAGCRLSVEGGDALRERGPFIMASNHASYTDVAVLMALLPLNFVFVAKREVLRYPVVGTYVKKARHLTVERWDVQQSVADAGQVARALAAGDSVLFFPEGTFTAASGLRPFRMGAFKAASEGGVPVLPLALRGTRRVMRGTSWLPRPGRIHLWVGPPLRAEGTGWPAVVALRDRVASEIAAHCGEPVLDLLAGAPPRSPSD